MKAVVQRVTEARVTADAQPIAEIGPGLLLLVAAHKDDTELNAKKLAERVANLRIFNDDEGKMNLSLAEGHQVLAVSNFTVLGDTTQRRPSFVAAAPFDQGRALFDLFVEALRDQDVHTQTGEFGADMKVTLTNDGPVTVIIEA